MVSQNSSGQRKDSWKTAIFHTMTEAGAVTQTEEEVKGLENQISQKPRE